MRDILADICAQTRDLFEAVKVSGTTAETRIEAAGKDQGIFLQATLKTPAPDLRGEFAIGNLGLLNGLLKVPAYSTEAAKFDVGYFDNHGTVKQFAFTDDLGGQAIFRTMSALLLGPMMTIGDIPWQVSLIPSKAKIAELIVLHNLFSSLEPLFAVRTVNGGVTLTIGGDSASTHRVSMVFDPVVEGVMTMAPAFNTALFLAVIKLAGTHPVTLNVTDHGVLRLDVATPLGDYRYFLRAKL